MDEERCISHATQLAVVETTMNEIRKDIHDIYESIRVIRRTLTSDDQTGLCEHVRNHGIILHRILWAVGSLALIVVGELVHWFWERLS